MRRDSGFTLLELLFVVGLIGVAAAATIPAMNNAASRNKVFTASELMAAQVRAARLAAITRNRGYRVNFSCPDGSIRYLLFTGNPAIDDAPDRCTNPQPNDGPPVYLPSDVTFGPQPPATLVINGRGLIQAMGAMMPQSISVTYGSFTRTVVVTATGRISTPTS